MLNENLNVYMSGQNKNPSLGFDGKKINYNALVLCTKDININIYIYIYSLHDKK